MKNFLFTALLLITTACSDPSMKRSTITNINKDGTQILGPLTDEIEQTVDLPVVNPPVDSIPAPTIPTPTTPTVPTVPTLPTTGGETPSEPTTGNSNGSGDSSGSGGESGTPIVVVPPVITEPTTPTTPTVPDEEPLPDEPADTSTEDTTIPEVTPSPICPNSIPSDVSLRGYVSEDKGTSYSYKLSVKNNSTVDWDFTMCFYFNHKVNSPKNANYTGTQPHWKLWSKKKLPKGKVRLIEWTASPGNVGNDEIRAIQFIKTKNATCPLFPNYCD